jgi:hypothetical protein
MNTHLDLGTEHDQKLARTLKSLSLETVAHDIEPPKLSFRRLTLSLGFSAFAVATVLAVVLYQPDVVRRIKTIFAAGPGLTSETTSDEPSASSEEADIPHDARNAERSTVRKPVPAAREITGSGFVVAPRMTTVFSKYEGRITIAVEAGGHPMCRGRRGSGSSSMMPAPALRLNGPKRQRLWQNSN